MSRYTQWFLWAPLTGGNNNNAAGNNNNAPDDDDHGVTRGGMLFPDKNGSAVLLHDPPSAPERVKEVLVRHLFPFEIVDWESTRPKLIWAYTLRRGPAAGAAAAGAAAAAAAVGV